MLGDWASYLIFLLIAAGIAGGMLAGSQARRRSKLVGRQKEQRFESGVAEGRFAPSNFSINYYLTAMLFVIFDIEIVFLYPLAVNLEILGEFGLAALLVFVAILAFGYIYDWRRGGLEWR
jgi:NADH-quinone oxidoreductase subunit A